MLWIWIVLGVVGAWLLVAALLALLIGRAAHMGEVKYQDEVYLRRAARDARTRSSISSVA
jgi:hypothetical protein